MESSALAWLTSDGGRELLKTAESLPPDLLTRVTRLRKLASPDQAAAAVEMIELRSRASAKFECAGQMIFTQIGLEQSTGDRVAKYRASKFPQGVPILDACSGIGGDAMHLSARGPVLTVDRDLASCVCTAYNCSFTKRSTQPVRSICADITNLDLDRLSRAGFQAAFLDPSRRSIDSGGTSRRTRNPEEYSPALSWLARLSEVFPFVCAKVSPLIDDGILSQVVRAQRCSVEFISDRGECKEAVLWAGDFGELLPEANRDNDSMRNGYTATVLDAFGTSSTLGPVSCPAPPIGSVAAWVFEPAGAVVRAHLTPALAARIPARLLDPGSYYLTSDADVHTPFATRYRVLDILPLRAGEIQKRCVALGRAVSAVKTRWVKISPDELSRRVSGAPKGSPAAVIIVIRVRERHMALICEPPSGPPSHPGNTGPSTG